MQRWKGEGAAELAVTHSPLPKTECIAQCWVLDLWNDSSPSAVPACLQFGALLLSKQPYFLSHCDRAGGGGCGGQG